MGDHDRTMEYPHVQCRVLLCMSLLAHNALSMEVVLDGESSRHKDLIPIVRGIAYPQIFNASLEKQEANVKKYKATGMFYEDLRNRLIKEKFKELGEVTIATLIRLLDIGAFQILRSQVVPSEYKWLLKRQIQCKTMRDIAWITTTNNRDAIQQLCKLSWVKNYRKKYFNKLREYGLCSKIK